VAAINRNDSEPEQTENFYETRDSHTLRSTGSRLKRERRFARIKTLLSVSGFSAGGMVSCCLVFTSAEVDSRRLRFAAQFLWLPILLSWPPGNLCRPASG